ncbi:MAG: hypothetical protein ACRYGF_04490 [Janthinobacterium lividum]
MAEMKFDGGTAPRRSMLVPILLALLALAAAGAWFAKVYVHASVTGTATAVKTFPVHVVYKHPTGGNNMTVGADQTEDALYVVADVMLHNRSEVPLFLSSFHGSFTLGDGSVMEANLIEKDDLPRIMAMFPKLKAEADALGTGPLLREASVAKGATGRGYLVMYYNIPQGIWDQRKSADVSVDFYHQDRLTLPLPK